MGCCIEILARRVEDVIIVEIVFRSKLWCYLDGEVTLVLVTVSFDLHYCQTT